MCGSSRRARCRGEQGRCGLGAAETWPAQAGTGAGTLACMGTCAAAACAVSPATSPSDVRLHKLIPQAEVKEVALM